MSRCVVVSEARKTMSDTNLTLDRNEIETGAFVKTVTDANALTDDETVKAGIVEGIETEYNHALDAEQTFVVLNNGDETWKINIGHFENDNDLCRIAEYHVSESGDEDDDGEEEKELVTDGGEEVADVRTDSMKIKMARHFEDFEHEYRDDEDTHAEVVYEDEDCRIVADHTGHELNEWASDFDVDRSELSSLFHEMARQKMGEKEAHEWFSYCDPVVFDTFEEDN